MRKLILALVLGLLALASHSEAQAHHGGGNLGFIPFGFYQPYGVRYSTTVRTPPYFALNPPVYYGTRYHRPYGVSPFAAPPQVSVPADYQAQRAPQQAFVPARVGAVVCNPFVVQAVTAAETEIADAAAATEVTADAPAATTADEVLLPQRVQSSTGAASTTVLGPIRTNPYVTDDNLAAR